MNIDETMEKMRRELGVPVPPGAPLSADELMVRVRAEVARRRQPAGSAANASSGDPADRTVLARWAPSAERLPFKSEYRLSDMLSLSDLDFVDQCYRILMRRPPDQAGIDHYVAQLRLGRMSKVEVLGEMRFSPEGVSRGVHVDGLLLPYGLHRAMKWPLLGPVLRWCHGLLRLGSFATRLQQLDAAQAREAHCLGHTLNRVAAQLDDRIVESEASVRKGLVSAGHALQELQSHLENRAEAVELVLPQLARRDEVGRGLDAARERAEAIESMLPQLARREEMVRGFETARERADAIEAMLPQFVRQDTFDALVEEARTTAMQLSERAKVLEAVLPQLARRDQMEAGLDDVRHLAASLAGQVQQMASREAMDGLQAALQASLDELRQSSEQLGQRIAVGEQTQARLDQVRRKAEEMSRALDPFYAAFEDRFRGSRDLVRSRVEPYLQWVRDAVAGTREAPVLDLGCGRGEWLELLRDNQMYCRGIDLNSTFVEICRGRGLEVQHADVMDGLAGCPDQSVGAVTSMHLVEHLPFETAIAMIDEARRVLRPGGLLLLETPNPENLRVGAHWFYMDPKHRNPIPPETLRWLVESRGFQSARIERLTHGRDLPWPGRVADDVPGAETINAMSDQFVAAPDYAIVAVRP